MKHRAYMAGWMLVGCLAAAMGRAAESSASAQVALPTGTVALVNDVPIVRGEVDDVLAKTHLPDSPEMREVAVRGLIGRELVRQAALGEGLDRAPTVAGLTGTTRVNAENRLYLERHLQVPAVTDAQVKSAYDAMVAEKGPREYQTRIIAVRDAASAAGVLEKLKAGVAFDEVARETSMDSTREAGGALPWVSFKTPPAEGKTMGVALPIAQEIARLQPGQVSSTPIAVAGQFVIVKLEASRPTQTPGYDVAAPGVRKFLEARGRNAAFERLVAGLAEHARIVR